jgi:hypothetical protein
LSQFFQRRSNIYQYEERGCGFSDCGRADLAEGFPPDPYRQSSRSLSWYRFDSTITGASLCESELESQLRDLTTRHCYKAAARDPSVSLTYQKQVARLFHGRTLLDILLLLFGQIRRPFQRLVLLIRWLYFLLVLGANFRTGVKPLQVPFVDPPSHIRAHTTTY